MYNKIKDNMCNFSIQKLTTTTFVNVNLKNVTKKQGFNKHGSGYILNKHLQKPKRTSFILSVLINIQKKDKKVKESRKREKKNRMT